MATTNKELEDQLKQARKDIETLAAMAGDRAKTYARDRVSAAGDNCRPCPTKPATCMTAPLPKAANTANRQRRKSATTLWPRPGSRSSWARSSPCSWGADEPFPTRH